MIDRLVPAAWAALFGALTGVGLLAVWYLVEPRLKIDFAVDPPRLITGVHPGERDEATGLTFAWTGRDVALRVPGLDRRVPWTVDLRIRGGRQNAADNPSIVMFVDGQRVLERQTRTEFETVTIDVPSRSDRPRGLMITLQTSSTFVPGPSDPRPLGVMLDVVTLTPKGFALPPRDAFAAAGTAGAALGAAIGLLGVTPGLAIAAAVLLAAGLSAVLARGFGPFTGFTDVVTRAAMATAVVLALASMVVERIRRQRLRKTARFAVVFSAGAFFLKAVVMLHPDMPIGDALFQAHRFQGVLRGNYYFTSIAPGNYLFPYAPGLYVAAMPFGDLVRREMGDVMLLRIVVLAADALAGVLLYPIVAHAWRDRRAAACATALYQLLPLDFLIASGGTLTNAFAQSVAVIALTVVATPWLRLERGMSVAMAALVLLAAFLSHTSTFAILSVAVVAVSAAFFVRGGSSLRSPAAAVFLSAVVAVVLAVVIYYAHFLDTYRTEFARISAEAASAAPDAGGRTIGERLNAVPFYLISYFGLPSLALAAAGAAVLWSRSARDRLTLVVAGWGVACVAFLVLGVLTPVDMRYYVAALPVISLLASAGASGWWDRGGWRRMATSGLLAWTAWLGVRTWWGVLW